MSTNNLVEFAKGDYNEAETRQKLIDTVIYDILKWPKTYVKVENKTNEEEYIDYLMLKKDKPLWIIEAKRSSIYFELPEDMHNNQVSRKIKVRTLLTNQKIKTAIEQAKDYAEDIGVDYISITNGIQWITLFLKPKGRSWKDQSAHIIANNKYFINTEIEAINSYGYTAVTEKQSLLYLVALQNIRSNQLWTPSQKITSYDRPVANNKYSAIFGTLSRKYLGDIDFENSEFMNKCYVYQKKEDSALRNNIENFISDSITPYFESHGVKQIADPDSGDKFGKKVRKFATNINNDSVLILFGGRGSGKSTFIRRFLYHNPASVIANQSVVSIVNLLNCAQESSKLSNEIWSTLVLELDFDQILKSDREKLLNFFEPEYSIFESQILSSIEKGTDYHSQLINDFIKENLNKKEYLAKQLSNYWRHKNRGVIVVIDNMDQLSADLQDMSFLTAMEISSKLNCLVIISMREERFYEAKKRGVLDAYHNNGYHIASPSISTVIKRRLHYILDEINKSKDIEDDFNIEKQEDLEKIKQFIVICIKDLARIKSELKNFLDFTTHGDVRQALDYYKNFIVSGYTQVDDIVNKPSWTFSHHQVIKPMMIPDRYFYSEDVSLITNIYKIRNNGNGSHFTGYRLLKLLLKAGAKSRFANFTDLRWLLELYDAKFGQSADCIEHIDNFLRRGVIEANNRLDFYSINVDKVRLTFAHN